MNKDEIIWAQYASAALGEEMNHNNVMLRNHLKGRDFTKVPPQEGEFNAFKVRDVVKDAANCADLMLAEHKKRFPESEV